MITRTIWKPLFRVTCPDVSIVFIIMLLTLSKDILSAEAAKVLDVNENLSDFIEKHSEKSWLVKFYAPWCHHCQQLEPTYHNVAETIYDKYDNLIVGRVDCTKAGRVCEQFGVSSYPTIKFITKNNQIDYKGDRSKESIIAFADRLQGPTVNLVRGCRELTEATDKHGLVILSTIVDESDPVRLEFESLARTYKATHWFYQFKGNCSNLFNGEGVHILKRHLDRSIRFELSDIQMGEGADHTVKLKKAMLDWMSKESFPVYGQVSFRNFEKLMATGRLLIISILDEYKPARRFTPTSREFYKKFELLARHYAQLDDEVLFGWSSDIELIEYVTISSINLTPNVIILKSDFRYHLMLSNDSDLLEESLEIKKNVEKVDSKLLDRLSGNYLRSTIEKARAGKLNYSGGNSYLFVVWRYIMGNLNRFTNMYRANPLLVSVIFGFPSIIIIFVIYTTCFYEDRESDDDDEGYSDNEFDDDDINRRLLDDDDNGHLKRD